MGVSLWTEGWVGGYFAGRGGRSGIEPRCFDAGADGSWLALQCQSGSRSGFGSGFDVGVSFGSGLGSSFEGALLSCARIAFAFFARLIFW